VISRAIVTSGVTVQQGRRHGWNRPRSHPAIIEYLFDNCQARENADAVYTWVMRVPQLPESLLWDHNAHYHRWLLRQLPVTGVLASRLAQRADRVDAVDQSAVMIERARTSWPRAARVRWLHGDLLDPDLPLAPDGYDVVTALSSLHHLPLNPGLARLASLVRPGGVLLVVGLYRIDAPADYAFEAISLPANGVMGAILALRSRAGKPHDLGMPVRDAQATLADIRAAARELTPGARIRRRVFWRYSLVWHRPLGQQGAEAGLVL
jgi:SAM-dependent methyltransferase